MSRFSPLSESLKVEGSPNLLIKSRGKSVQGELFLRADPDLGP